MRTLSVLLPLLCLCSVPLPSSGEVFTGVKCNIHLATSTLKPGAKGEIVVSFAPEEGIHINTDPAIEFEFEKDTLVHFTGITSMPKAEKTGQLDTKRPIRYSFTLDKNIQKGKHTLRGSLLYFFCSDTEGWCNRSSQPIQLTFTVTQ
jgi:hypothetical protein